MNEKSSDQIKLTIPNKPEYVGVVRLTVSSIANRMGFDVEQIEDIKIATAEACTNAIIHGKCDVDNSFNITFTIEEGKLVISVFDNGQGCMINNIKTPDLSNPKEGGLGIFIIKSLMDDVKITSDYGKGTTITMTKYVGEDV